MERNYFATFLLLTTCDKHLSTLLHFVLRVGSKWPSIDQSLGASAAAESMLLCISFIDRRWAPHSDPALCSGRRKHFSEQVGVNSWVCDRSGGRHVSSLHQKQRIIDYLQKFHGFVS